MNKALNTALLVACLADRAAMCVIENLLRKGANPLGSVTDYGGYKNNLYSVIIGYIFDGERCEERLPYITELFLKYGMEVSRPELPYDDIDRINPMWLLALNDSAGNDYYLKSLKLILDSGIDAYSAYTCWNHAYENLVFYPDLENEYDFECICKDLRTIFLIASYPHILNSDEELKKIIGLSENDYDLMKFRQW